MSAASLETRSNCLARSAGVALTRGTGLAGDGETGLIAAGKSERANGAAFVVDGSGDGNGFAIAHVPDKAIEAGVVRKSAMRRRSEGGIRMTDGLRLGDAGETANDVAVGVENVERNGVFGLRGEGVINDDAVGRVHTDAGDATEEKARAAETDGGCGLVEMNGSGESLGGHLAKSGNVVERPESAAVSGDDEVVAVNG